MKTVCTRCEYRFEARTLRDACPYCGSKNALTELENAEDLVNGA